jgi:hypothetical protein
MRLIFTFYDERGNVIDKTEPITPGEEDHIAIPLDAMYYTVTIYAEDPS